MENAIYGIIFLFIILSILIVLYNYYNRIYEVIKEQNNDDQKQFTSSKLGPSVYDKCLPGYCVTSLSNGVKRCPLSSNDSLAYNASIEVCNPEFYCLDKNLPYALNSTGNVNENGICEEDKRCRCVKDITSFYYSTVYFTLDNGSPYIEQKTEENYNIVQNVITESVKNPGKAIFKLPEDSFYKLNPNVTNRLESGCDLGVKERPDYKNMLNCTFKNPCILGQFSYNVDDKDSRNFCNFLSKGKKYMQDPEYYTLGCSIGDGCYYNDQDKTKYFPDYDEQAFDDVNDNIKKIGVRNLYYPIFNPNTYKQECIRCYPLIITNLVFDNNNKLGSVDIIYSGEDFEFMTPLFVTYPEDYGQKFKVTVVQKRITKIELDGNTNKAYVAPLSIELNISKLIF